MSMRAPLVRCAVWRESWGGTQSRGLSCCCDHIIPNVMLGLRREERGEPFEARFDFRVSGDVPLWRDLFASRTHMTRSQSHNLWCAACAFLSQRLTGEERRGWGVASNLHLLASFFCTRGEISPNLENSSEHPRASESIWRYLQVSTCIYEHLQASTGIYEYLWAHLCASGRMYTSHFGCSLGFARCS